MPRIKKTDVEERENYMLDLFKKDPGLSAARANQALQKKYGAMMRAKRVYELRGIARKETVAGAESQSEGKKPGRKPGPAPKMRPQIAARPSKPAPMPAGDRNRLVVLEGTPENMQFLNTVVDVLNEAGLTNLRIDHSSATYAVLVSA